MAIAGPDAAVLWAIIACLAVGTYAIRLSFFYLFGRVDEVPAGFANALRFTPAAVLAALALPGFLTAEASIALSPENHRLFAGAVGGIVAWRTGSILATVAAGMLALWGLQLAV